jgi:hypoxanthine-guanine phosphoribosyltransferase
MQSDIERVLFGGPAIHKRLDEIAAQITADYSDRELTVIAILPAALCSCQICCAEFHFP